jgi:hypothetical protein
MYLHSLPLTLATPPLFCPAQVEADRHGGVCPQGTAAGKCGVSFHPDSCGSSMGEKSYSDLSDTIHRLVDAAHRNQHALQDIGHTVTHGAYADANAPASLSTASSLHHHAPHARADAPRPPHPPTARRARRRAWVTSLEAEAASAAANATANATAKAAPPADRPKGGFPMAEGVLQVRGPRRGGWAVRPGRGSISGS